MAESFKSRAEKRAYIGKLASDYGVTFHIAQKAVKSGVHFRAIALATGESNKSQAFTAAVNVLTH